MSPQPVPLHIAVGVVADADGRILISERKPDCAYAGQWEFPGGKCEPGETVQAALARELNEELGLVVRAARPLICLDHRYPDRHVRLDSWRVTAWDGVAESREGQRLAWVAPEALSEYPMLAANRPILRAVQLPDRYLITPEPGPDHAAFLAALARSLAAGVRLLRLRAHSLSDTAYAGLARDCLALCRQHGARLLLDRDPALVQALGADGLHLTVRALAACSVRPLPPDRLLAASCHDQAELERALALGADFAVLGPVQATATHPGRSPLGWSGFRREVAELPLPVYGLGGLSEADLETAWAHRAQGIAAVRGLWRE